MIAQLAQESHWPVVAILLGTLALLVALVCLFNAVTDKLPNWLVSPVWWLLALEGIAWALGLHWIGPMILVGIAIVLSTPPPTTDELIRSEIYRQRL